MATADALQDTVNTLTWLDVIRFVGFPAFFGGTLQVAHELIYGSLSSEKQHRPTGDTKTKLAKLLDVIIGGLFGVGGGAAVILAVIWLSKFEMHKFDMESSDENELYLIVLGVVAGFVGYRILPRVARSLEERMAITEKEADHALEDAKKAAKAAEIALEKAEKAQIITNAISLIEAKRYVKAEKYLVDIRKNYPLDDLIYYKLANMYKRQHDYNSAIDLTNKYIEDLRAAKMDSDVASAAALYNRACYTTLKAMLPPRDDVLLAKALDDLKRAIFLDPSWKETARIDDDFKILRDASNARFVEIVGQ